MDDDRRSGDHGNALGHPGLGLDVGLLRVRPDTLLVSEGLIRVIAGSEGWDSLYVPLVPWIAAWTVERGWVGIWRTASLVWGSSAVAVGWLVHRDGDTGGGLVVRVLWDYHGAGAEGDRRAAATLVM